MQDSARSEVSLGDIKRSLLTSHDAFFYTAKDTRYLEMCAVIDGMQLDEKLEVSLKRWAKLECQHPQSELLAG